MLVRNVFTTEWRKEQAHGGQGLVRVCRPLIGPDFVGPWHFVDYAVLPPETSIGLHRHGRDEELYFIIEGEGLMSVNGQQQRVVKGDLILNPPDGVHGLVNDSDHNLGILVVEVGLES